MKGELRGSPGTSYFWIDENRRVSDKHTIKVICASICSVLAEGGQLDFCFDLIFASKKDRTANKKVA